MKGHVLVIRFWSDCCSYNIHEMEGLDALYARHKHKGLAVLTIYSGSERGKAQGFADELKISYPVLLDVGSSVARRYGVSRLPTTFIVDRSGIVREKIIGASEKQAWQESYESVIASFL
jgi:peroxiredoxin